MNGETAVQPGGDTGEYAAHGWGFLVTQFETEFLWTHTLRN